MASVQPAGSNPAAFGAAYQNSNWENLVKDLVPLNTHLLTPTLAEAFEIPITLSAPQPPAPQPSAAGTSGHGNPSMDYQYQRPPFGCRPSVGAQQSLLNFFPATAQPGTAPTQPGNYHMDGKGQQMQGLTRQLQGLGVPNLQQQPLYNAKSEEKTGQQGFMGNDGQFPGWLDKANSTQMQVPPTAAKPQQESTVGSDPENAEDLQTRALKRPRLVWTTQLHQRFVDAVKSLGLKNAVPKTIMQLMSVDGLTRENVASHLQKYRLQLRKEEGQGGDDPEKDDDDEIATGDAEVPHT